MTHANTPGRERIDAGRLVAGAGAVLLAVSLFIDWFEPGVSAWTAFEAIDLVLAGAAAVVLAYAARAAGMAGAGQRAAMLAGLVALAAVVSQLVEPPPAAFDHDLEAGAWLALAGAALMLAGPLLGRSGVSLSLVVERRAGESLAREHEAAPPPGSAPGTPPPGTPPGTGARQPGTEAPRDPAGAPDADATTRLPPDRR